jgi:pseudaminic acid synthase
MIDIKNKFNVKVGVSDHTMGKLIPIVSVAMGAEVIEKHFILKRSLGGPDSSFSMEPNEFKEMVDEVRLAELALGKITYKVSARDKNRRRSIFVSKDIKKGELINEYNIKIVRPGYGLHPKYYNQVIDTRAIKDFKKGDPFITN